MNSEINLAPADELIRYLCLFRRAFVAMQKYVQVQDEEGILLMAWIADTLHNIPSLLWRYGKPPNNTPTQLAAWIEAFPQIVRNCSAPDHLIAACSRIFSPEGATMELELANDLRDLDVAPLDQMAIHLDLFYRACLAIRWRQPKRLPWRTRDQDWELRRLETTELMGHMADVLAPVPVGLVHWNQFDQEHFKQQTRTLWEKWPDGV